DKPERSHHNPAFDRCRDVAAHAKRQSASIRIADLIDEGFDVAVWVGGLPGLEPDRAPTRPLPHGRLRRAEVFREARHAAAPRGSRNPPLSPGGCDWIILLPHVVSDGGRRNCAEHLAYWKHAHQQWGG